MCDRPVLLQVTKMKMISPSNREVDVGKTLSETEYIGMCRWVVGRQAINQASHLAHMYAARCLGPNRP